MIKEFICQYCGKEGITVCKKGYEPKFHGKCWRKWQKEHPEEAIERLKKAIEISKEKRKNKISNNMIGNNQYIRIHRINKMDKIRQEKIKAQIIKEIKAETIPHLREILKEAKGQILSEVQEQMRLDTIDTMKLIIEIEKSIISKLHDMWQQVMPEGSDANIDTLKQYIAYYVKPLVRDVAEHLRKAIKDLHEMEYGKKVILEQPKKLSFKELFTIEVEEANEIKDETKNENNN